MSRAVARPDAGGVGTAVSPIQTRTRSSSSTARRWPYMRFLLEILQRCIIQLELPPERTIGQAAPLAQEGDHLIQDRDKVTLSPPILALSACT